MITSNVDEREKPINIVQVSCDGSVQCKPDKLAVEEPMEIRLVFGNGTERKMRSLSITMRTPGNDGELAAGFLLTEGILKSTGQIESISFRGVDPSGVDTGNIVRVDLKPDVSIDMAHLQRNFYTTSSCGVCGKSSLEALEVQGVEPVALESIVVNSAVIHGMPSLLFEAQPTFRNTGGLHAAGLFDADGKLQAAREDVGRHNAVDKLLGRAFLDDEIPVARNMMMVSGRASFEIVQKALVAGVPVVVAVGAPSSLAVEMAVRFQMTLIGFASSDRFNIYSKPERILTG